MQILQVQADALAIFRSHCGPVSVCPSKYSESLRPTNRHGSNTQGAPSRFRVCVIFDAVIQGNLGPLRQTFRTQ